MEVKTFRADFNPVIAAKIKHFKEKEELSTDAAAIRKLVVFALNIIESSAEAPAVSNREIFEELLTVVKSNSSLVSQVHGYTFNDDVSESARATSKLARNAARKHGKKQTEEFLIGK